MVAGCLAQKDRDAVTDRAPYVDVVFGTHNVHRAADLLHEARDAGHSIVEILEETVAEDHDAFPSALPVRREVPWAGWVTIQIGCDNSCAFCIVPAVRGKEISRPFDDIVDEVAARGGRRRHRGHAARPEREQLRPRPRARRAPGGRRRTGAAAVRRLLRAVGRRRGDPPCALHEPAPEGPAARDHRRHGRDAGGVRAPPPAAAVRQRPRAGRHAPGLHRRALPRPPPAARAAIDDLAVTTDIIVGFPGETDDDFERTLEVAAEAAYDSAYTFIYSPRPGTEAAEMVDEQVPPEVVAERFERLRIVVERSGLAAPRSPRRTDRGGGRGGPLPQGPGGPVRPDPPEQARPLRRRARPRRAPTPRCG